MTNNADEYRCTRCGDDVGSDSLRQCECGMRLCHGCEWHDDHGIPCIIDAVEVTKAIP